jgi:translation initiation factor 1A
MVKNTKGGKGQKKIGRKFTQEGGNRVLRQAKEEGEFYACVSKVLGNNMAHILSQNNKTMLLHIRNKFRGRGKRDNTIVMGTYVLAGERTFETVKSDKLSNCDLLEVYNVNEIDKLKKENPEVSWNLFKDFVNPITKNEDDNHDITFENIDEEAEKEILQEIIGDNKGDTINLGNEDIDFDDI